MNSAKQQSLGLVTLTRKMKLWFPLVPLLILNSSFKTVEDDDNSDNDNNDDHIDFAQAVTDPDTGLMCVYNQGTRNKTFRYAKIRDPSVLLCVNSKLGEIGLISLTLFRSGGYKNFTYLWPYLRSLDFYFFIVSSNFCFMNKNYYCS